MAQGTVIAHLPAMALGLWLCASLVRAAKPAGNAMTVSTANFFAQAGWGVGGGRGGGFPPPTPV